MQYYFGSTRGSAFTDCARACCCHFAKIRSPHTYKDVFSHRSWLQHDQVKRSCIYFWDDTFSMRSAASSPPVRIRVVILSCEKWIVNANEWSLPAPATSNLDPCKSRPVLEGSFGQARWAHVLDADFRSSHSFCSRKAFSFHFRSFHQPSDLTSCQVFPIFGLPRTGTIPYQPSQCKKKRLRQPFLTDATTRHVPGSPI